MPAGGVAVCAGGVALPVGADPAVCWAAAQPAQSNMTGIKSLLNLKDINVRPPPFNLASDPEGFTASLTGSGSANYRADAVVGRDEFRRR